MPQSTTSTVSTMVPDSVTSAVTSQKMAHNRRLAEQGRNFTSGLELWLDIKFLVPGPPFNFSMLNLGLCDL